MYKKTYTTTLLYFKNQNSYMKRRGVNFFLNKILHLDFNRYMLLNC